VFDFEKGRQILRGGGSKVVRFAYTFERGKGVARFREHVYDIVQLGGGTS